MIPIRSTSTKESCSPLSSNCVVWQGPDIACLNLCKGDSISDVTYKLATEVCTLIDNMGISAVDLSVIVTKCNTTPEPVKTLTNILNLIIDKVICVADAVAAIPPVPDPYVEPDYQLTTYSCLTSYIVAGTTTYQLSDFVKILAEKLCSVDGDISNLQVQVAQNTSQIANIEASYYNSMTDLPKVANCYTNSVDTIDVVLKDVADTVCDYANSLGAPIALDDVIKAQCKDLSTEKQLSGNTTYPMSAITSPTGVSWTTTVTTVAQSLQNLWLTVCDIRAAVKLIQENCCKVTCDDIVVDFDYKWVTDNKDVTLVLYFFPKTNVPAGFYDCGDTGIANIGPGQTFTFTDGNGRTWNYPGIHFRHKDVTMVNDAIMTDTDIQLNGYTPISFTNANNIDITTGLTITSNVCFTDGTNSCIKCVNKEIAPYVDPNQANNSCCVIGATAAVTIVYKTCVSND